MPEASLRLVSPAHDQGAYSRTQPFDAVIAGTGGGKVGGDFS